MENVLVHNIENKTDIDTDIDTDILLIFLMKDFIKNNSLENLSDDIFTNLVKKKIIKSKNISDTQLESIKKNILQNISPKEIINKSRFINDFSMIEKIGKGIFSSTNK